MSAAALLLVLAGCGGRHGPPRAEGAYEVGLPGEGWRREKPGGADHAWFNPTTGASIYTDSNCASMYEDRPLPDLVEHLMFGVVDGAFLQEEALTLDGRDALVRVGEGKLDGVPVRVGAAVTKKHDCMYDVVYIAHPTRFQEGWGSFQAVLAGFHTRGG